MKYLFILGRNIALSIEEVKSFFEREEIKFKINSTAKNGILIEINEKLASGIINKFGGVISIGEVLADGEEIFKELKNKTLYSGNSNKLNYVIFDFNGKNFEQISIYLKKRFREEGLKATEKKLTGILKLQGGGEISNLSSKLINEKYFLFKENFGRINESCDYEKLEKRDMEKPVRRNELSISPRLAKILINLSQVKKGETLLDPFCGVGTILQEALLQNIKVIGVDKDKEAVKSARLNLKWFNFQEKDYNLINGDSSKLNIHKVQAIATEPDLGELQKGMPSEEKAKQIIAGFEKLIISVIKNLKKNVRGRIVFTAPLIQADRKRISCDFKKISSETGLKILRGFPIDEFRENSIVGRSILVMER